MKPRFKLSEQLATDLLLSSGVQDFPFDVTTLSFDHDIIFDTMQNYCRITNTDLIVMQGENNKDGFIVVYNDLHLVLYNENSSSPERMNWTNAHECGHVLCGHTVDDGKSEIEAHFFAASLLMPNAIIYELSQRGIAITEETLIDVFGVSPEAAAKKMTTLNKLTWKSIDSIHRGREMLVRFSRFIESVFDAHTVYLKGEIEYG